MTVHRHSIVYDWHMYHQNVAILYRVSSKNNKYPGVFIVSVCVYLSFFIFRGYAMIPLFFSFVLWILWQGYCSSVLVILVCWGDFFLFCFVCFCLQQSSSYRLYSTGSLQHLPHNMKRTSQIKPICLWDKIYYVLHLNCIKKIKNY